MVFFFFLIYPLFFLGSVKPSPNHVMYLGHDEVSTNNGNDYHTLYNMVGRYIAFKGTIQYIWNICVKGGGMVLRF